MRLRRTLATGWEFAPDCDAPAMVDGSEPTVPTGPWRPVLVPGYWQSQFRDLARATGPAWYRLSFDLDQTWFDRDVLALEFGAVSHYCQGWLNDRYLGDHEGGHLPFTWTLDGVARAGTNELLVRVVTPSGDRSRFPDFPFEETLHGKQSWYGPAGGIWQEVVLEARSGHSVEALRVQADPAKSAVDIHVDLGPTSDPADIEVEIVDPEGVTLSSSGRVAPNEPITIDMRGVDLERWSPDAPRLYTARATVLVGGDKVDVAEKRFGFRTFEASEGRFLLNGEPLLMRGVLDQDYYDTPGVPPSKQALIERFEAVKAMGFNLVRCHIKVPDPWYLDAADEVGMLVWCELPSTSRLTHAARTRIEKTLAAMIERDRHHPSVVVLSIANEAWGYDLVGNAEHRSWLRSLYRVTKADVADRLIVDNSPCSPNFHIETDIEDYHFYAVIPEMRERWDRFLDEFCDRAPFTFSRHGDAERSRKEPLVVSEFGAWGLPDLSDLEAGREPWWFESGQEWAAGAAYVHGARERFALWHLDKVFGSWAQLCGQTQRRQYETMRYQIETMRLRPEIAGYVLTELSDVHWEANGLLDMRSRPRSFSGDLAGLNDSPALIARPEAPVLRSGETVRMAVSVINNEQLRDPAHLQYVVDEGPETSTEPAEPLLPHERREFEPFEMTIGCSDGPEQVDITCSLFSDRTLVATTQQRVLVLPDISPPTGQDRTLVVRDDSLAKRLTAMGYAVTADEGPGLLRVLHQLGAGDRRFVEEGGRALLLARDAGALGPGFGEFPRIELKPWFEALHGGGEWISAFSWLRRTGRFAGLPGGPMMDSVFEGLTPDVVITGIPPARFEYDVFAGVFVGWVHQIAASIARHPAGLGSVLVSTLKLTDPPPASSPMANWLLHQLIATAWEQS